MGIAVAQALGTELDVMVVHKVGVPGHPQIAAGALASGAANINHRAIGGFGISPVALEHVLDKERLVLEQHERELRSGRPAKHVSGRTIILVDDGIATGTTLRTAITALRARQAKRVVAAVPIASEQALEALQHEADQVICPSTGSPFFALGRFYEDFSPVSAAFVKQLLDEYEAHAQRSSGNSFASHDIPIQVGGARIAGTLTAPRGARGLVLLLHGSGSNRFSPRNACVARVLERSGFATLLVDLLTAEEQALDGETHELRSDVSLLAARAVAILDWIRHQPPLSLLPLGVFGASTGAAAALVAATRRPTQVRAVVSRGGRPDLAEQALPAVRTPTLLIVGAEDHTVLELNRAAARRLGAPHRLDVVTGAGHLFEEPGALERVGDLTARFFAVELTGDRSENAITRSR